MSLRGHSEVVDRLIAARAVVDAADKVLPRSRPRRPHARTADAASRQHYMRSINLRPTCVTCCEGVLVRRG
jgi:hypothetical protein